MSEIYTIPNTTVEVHELLPNTHISPETAYVIDNYPYGFRLRCKIRYWLEYTPKKGFRLWSQTTNPKKGNVWNKPKASTYARFGGAMFLDQEGHVLWQGLSEYSGAAESREFKEHFFDAVPEAGQKIVNAWIAAKEKYDEVKKEPMDTTAAAHATLAFAKALKE